MTALYTYTDKKITQFLLDPQQIVEELTKYDILYHSSTFHDVDEFIKQVMDEYDYTHYDIIKIESPMIMNSLHRHKFREARFIFKGTGTFYFNIDNKFIELNVGPGDFITIPPMIDHNFKTVEVMDVMRFAQMPLGNYDEY